MSSLANIFGVHETALKLYGERVGVLAANLSNADTPNFKARDMDFAAVLQNEGEKSLGLIATSTRHLSAAHSAVEGGELKYRIPFQPSLDGNTVEVPIEQAAFAQNSVRYQASLMFINRRISTIETAITGQ